MKIRTFIARHLGFDDIADLAAGGEVGDYGIHYYVSGSVFPSSNEILVVSKDENTYRSNQSKHP